MLYTVRITYNIPAMIRTFRCKDTAKPGRNRRFHQIAKVACRKLDMLDAAKRLDDLRAPPSNRLEVLKGDRTGYFSIRINDQWRLCFAWAEDGIRDVEMVDYH